MEQEEKKADCYLLKYIEAETSEGTDRLVMVD
jgi:hypothetical protein